MRPLKYFVFNKRRDYLHGYMEHIRITEQGIALYPEDVGQQGTFISRLLDSREEGNQWYRAVIQSAGYGDDSIRFFFYCSDSTQVTAGEQVWEWEELICSQEFTVRQKHEIMRPYLVHQVPNPQDILLYHAKGRFLWMEIQLFCQAETAPKIMNMKIYAQGHSFLRFLPEIYQNEPENDFLKRYLSLFEAVYQDMDAKIRTSARQLDPQAASTEFLIWMARWAGISDVQFWPEEKLRTLLNGIVKKNLIRGTKAYMEYMIEVFTGESPLFVEYGEIEQYKDHPGVYRNLIRYYAHGPYEVNILIREQAVPSMQEQKALKKIIENMKPAHIEVHLIFLKPYIYLNQNVYVGINTVLGSYQRARLNSMTAIPSVIGIQAGAQPAFVVGGVCADRHVSPVTKKEAKDHEESEKFSI